MVEDRIQVAIRVRPLSEYEKCCKSEPCLSTEGERVSFLHRINLDTRTYEFDNVLQRQEDVYTTIGMKCIQNALSGYNGCILAYGHAGTGKTYTIMGNRYNPGLIPRICKGLFQLGPSISISVSYFDVQNEVVHDLLGPANGTFLNKPEMMESSQIGTHIKGITQITLEMFENASKVFRKAMSRRRLAASGNTPSTVHSVLILTIKHNNSDLSTLKIVDLGSVNGGHSTRAHTVKRIKDINDKSMDVTHEIVNCLAQSSSRKRAPAIPYKGSILTWILKDALGGGSRTYMIACVSPIDHTGTFDTLKFIRKVGMVENTPRSHRNESQNGGNGETFDICEGAVQDLEKLREMGYYLQSKIVRSLEHFHSSRLALD